MPNAFAHSFARVQGASSQHLEKWLMRAAFDTKGGESPYLPQDVLWRQKEQFSDGVGYSWIDGLKAHAERVISVSHHPPTFLASASHCSLH